jgi:enoyl-CoA hydratase/carnithine racemase
VNDDRPLLVADHGDWLELTVNRPARRNALTPDLLFQLAEAVKGATDKALLVLRGAGDRAFSSGFDLGVLRELGPRAHDGDPLGTAGSAIADSPVPAVAVLQGYCWGAAVELVAACDLRIGGPTTSIAVPANKMGALYRPSGMDTVARRFGHQAAVDLFVFGMAFDATTALSRGLISAVVASCDLDEAVRSLADRITGNPELPKAHKQFLREHRDATEPLPELLARWQTVRDAGLATREVP